MNEHTRFARNPFFEAETALSLVPAPRPDVRAWHRALPGYAPTPLVRLPALAKALGVGELLLKDESQRFGLNAFKALGASYAMYRFVKSRFPGVEARLDAVIAAASSMQVTFATATDGNHGRAVAWAAKALRQGAVVFVPRNTVPARIAAIRSEGAECIVVEGNYDDTVRHAAEVSAKNGWQVIADTAYEGYLEIPGWIMAGYETIFLEAAEQMREAGLPDFPGAVLLQAGVGGLAWAGTAFYLRRVGQRCPTLVSVEPADADCLLESILSPDGSIRQALGRQNSIMAGLNCGTPSLLAWPLLRSGMHFFLAIDDGYAAEAMRMLAACGVISGESGAAGMAGLLALAREPALAKHRETLRLGEASTVLIVNTEGDTDPASYRRIVGRSGAASPAC